MQLTVASRERSSVAIRGPLGALLRASRYAGVAPYRSMRLLRTSRPYYIYGCCLFFVSIMVFVTTMTCDRVLYSDNDVLLPSSTSAWVLWALKMVSSKAILGIAMLKGPLKLRRLWYFTIRTKKIIRSINSKHPTSLEDRKIYRGIVSIFLILFILIIENICRTVLILNQPYEFLRFAYTTLYFDIDYIIILILAIQFILLVATVNLALDAVNQGLEELSAELSLKGDNEKIPDISEYTTSVSVISLTTRNRTDWGIRPSGLLMSTSHERVRQLANAYVSMCEIVRQINSSEGGLLMLIITSNIANMLSLAYNVVKNFNEIGPIAPNAVSAVMLTVSRIIWSFFHLMKIGFMITPCHRMAEEVERTRSLVGKLVCEVSSLGDPLLAESEMFFRHLLLNQPSYAALGLCTLGRPLLLKIMAGVATYLAVFLEF